MKTDELKQAADIINASNTGAAAEVFPGYVLAKVPGLGYIGGKPAPITTEEKIYSVRGALRLVASME